MSASRITLAIVAVLLSGLAVAAAVFTAQDWDRRHYSDGDSIRRSAALDVPRDVLWQPPQLLNELAGASIEMYEPRLSWDGLTLYFVHGKAGANADIYTAHRTPTGWTEPQPLTGINTSYDDLGPEPSRDGRSLYFYSDRPDGYGGYDLWVAQRRESDQSDGGEWQSPTNLGSATNTVLNEYGPALAADGRHLYFASNRPPIGDTRDADPDAWPATVREEWFKRTYDLFVSEISAEGVRPAIALAAINTKANEGAACVSPAGDFLYFASDRSGGAGGFDLYRSRILPNGLQPPVNLGPAINSAYHELDPGLSQLGFALYFSSDRPLVRSAPPPATQPASTQSGIRVSDDQRRYQLYYTASREVFVEHVPIDWAALWAATWPLLVWLLLGLLSALLLWQLIRDIRAGRLSLLARCLLASLLLHCLLMFGLGYWKVKAALGEYVGGSGRTKVTLAAVGVGSDLVGQVRGNLVTDVSTPDAVAAESPRFAPQIAQAIEREPMAFEVETGEAAIAPPSLSHFPADAKEIVSAAHSAPPIGKAQPPQMATPAVAQPAVQPDAPQLEPDSPSIDTVRPNPQAVLPAITEPIRRADVAPNSTDSLSLDAPGRIATPDAVAPHGIRSSAAFAPLPLAAQSPSTTSLSVNTPTVSQPVAALENDDHRAAAPEPIAILPTSRPAVVTNLDTTASMISREVPAPGSETTLVGRATAISPQMPDAAPAPSQSPAPLVALAPGQSGTSLVLNLPHSAPAAQSGESSPGDQNTPSVAVAPLETNELRSNGGPLNGGSNAAPKFAAVNPPRSPANETGLPPLPQSGIVISDAQSRNDIGRQHASPPDNSHATPFGFVPLDLSLPPQTNARPDARIASPENSATGATRNATSPNAPGDSAPSRDHAPGKLFGKITDADTKAPLRDVIVRFDQATGPPLTAVSAADGTYELPVAETPDHFAVTATHLGYLPESHNVSGADIHGKRLRLDFSLRPANESVIAVEEEPEVHHLGNDLFEGEINSRFQRKSEGSMLVGEFPLSVAQAPPNLLRVSLSMMVKGLQCPPQIRINGTPLARRNIRSPADGSFGEIVLLVEPSLLREGDNEICVQAVNCTGDLDDFEFVNVQIRLTRNEPIKPDP